MTSTFVQGTAIALYKNIHGLLKSACVTLEHTRLTGSLQRQQKRIRSRIKEARTIPAVFCIGH